MTLSPPPGKGGTGGRWKQEDAPPITQPHARTTAKLGRYSRRGNGMLSPYRKRRPTTHPRSRIASSVCAKFKGRVA
jgi:hypothetical protein